MDRFEVEVINGNGEYRTTFEDLHEAVKEFYTAVAEHYAADAEVALHDLVEGQTLAACVAMTIRKTSVRSVTKL